MENDNVNEPLGAYNKSLSIGNYFEDFIKSRISAGRYKNADEVVRAGLRLLEEEENKVIALKAAIEEGIESGIAHDFNPESHLGSLKAKKGLNG
jgi:antitoxin ParD1/3/4